MGKTYTLSSMLKTQHESLDQADLAAQLDDSITIFTNALGKLVANAGSATEYIPYYSHVVERLHRYGSVHIYDGPWDKVISEQSNEQLTKLLEMNRAAVAKVRVGEDISNMPVVIAEERANNAVTLSHSYVDNSLMCPTCGDAVMGMILEDHLQTPGCKQAEMSRKLEKEQLVQVSEDDVMELAKTRKIDLFFHPTSYGVYVHKWVDGAIRSYNATNGGYAGLQLHEYLDKMSNKP